MFCVQEVCTYKRNLGSGDIPICVSLLVDQIKITRVLFQQPKEVMVGKTNCKKSGVVQRNFVAKHAQESGAGRHKDRKSDYRRKPKHRNQQLKESEYA